MRILSIDPGVSGGLALMTYTGLKGGLALPTIVEVLSMPTMARKKDGTGEQVASVVLAGELKRLSPDLVVIEQASAVAAPRESGKGKVQKQFGMGVAGAFNFGVGFGVILGVCASYPQIYVRPANWKKRLGLPSSRDNKDAARMLALQLFPYCAEQLKRKLDVGRAEAILIGYDYCQQLRRAGEISRGFGDADPLEPVSKAPPAGYTFDLELAS